MGWQQDDPRNALNRYSLFAMVLKVVLSRVPTRVNAAIAATAISAAINAYSTAVTPSRSCSNLWSMYMQ
jgi:hypothetical protein